MVSVTCGLGWGYQAAYVFVPVPVSSSVPVPAWADVRDWLRAYDGSNPSLIWMSALVAMGLDDLFEDEHREAASSAYLRHVGPWVGRVGRPRKVTV